MWLVVIHGMRGRRPNAPVSKSGSALVLSGRGRQPAGDERDGPPLKTSPKLPPVACRVIPRRGGTRPQLRALGEALERWSRRESSPGGLLHQVDHLALLDLLAEEFPQALVLEMAGASPETDPWQETVPTVGQASPNERGEATPERDVFLAFRRGDSFDRKRVIASLRQDIPGELVEDILIDSKSWSVLD
jgi:hypothetical protein